MSAYAHLFLWFPSQTSMNFQIYHPVFPTRVCELSCGILATDLIANVTQQLVFFFNKQWEHWYIGRSLRQDVHSLHHHAMFALLTMNETTCDVLHSTIQQALHLVPQREHFFTRSLIDTSYHSLKNTQQQWETSHTLSNRRSTHSDARDAIATQTWKDLSQNAKHPTPLTPVGEIVKKQWEKLWSFFFYFSPFIFFPLHLIFTVLTTTFHFYPSFRTVSSSFPILFHIK